MKFKVKFSENRIVEIAARYSYQIGEDDLNGIKNSISKKKYLTKDELRKIAYWKAPRSARHVEKNEEAYTSEWDLFL